MVLELNERRYQVFVSSTFNDLKEERQKVLQAILELRAFPAGMELFPSADDDQWDFIKREIDSSDYYTVLIAGKYGSIASDGLSYTEKEYDYALEKRKPIMAFLSLNLDELKGKSLESDPAIREKLTLFHKKAKAGKLVSFFSNPDELKSKVLMALVNSFQMKPAEGWVRAKNARRIEDLEELASLQKRVLMLERENEALREIDGTEIRSLSQGKDVASWPVELTSIFSDEGILEPPVTQFVLDTTWDRLLYASFMFAMPKASKGEVLQGITFLLKGKLEAEYPGEWASKFAIDQVEKASIAVIFDRIRIQLLGLGFIEIEEVLIEQNEGHLSALSPLRVSMLKQPPRKREFWKLTHRGAARCAFIVGDLRARPERSSMIDPALLMGTASAVPQTPKKHPGL